MDIIIRTSCLQREAIQNALLLYIHLYFIFGRRASGFFDIRTLDGQKVNKGSISFKKLKLKETNKTYLIERRKADTGVSLAPLTTEVMSFRQTG